MNLKNKKIILSKTNQLGDVIMGLAVAKAIKNIEPSCIIFFLATNYTQDLIKHFPAVNHFLNWDEMKNDTTDGMKSIQKVKADIIIHLRAKKKIAQAAKKAGIPLRIGSIYRLYNWFSCNKILNISRNNSSTLHDVQFDLKYITALKPDYKLPTMTNTKKLVSCNVTTINKNIYDLIDPTKFNLILHPKSITLLERVFVKG